MVGIQLSYWVSAYFQRRTVSFRECTTISFSVGLAIHRSLGGSGWCIYLHENTPIYTQMKVTRPAIIEYLGTYIQYTAILVPYIQYLGSYICCIHPQSLTAHPCKMIGLEEDPASFLVFGILSGESSLVKLSRSS